MTSREPRWKTPSRQAQGRITERDILKKRGLRAHPNSGAGSIKYDGSDSDLIAEVKDANKTFTLNGKELGQSHRHAMKQGKGMVWLIKFGEGIPRGHLVEVRIVSETER